jgi:hypothetical protein
LNAYGSGYTSGGAILPRNRITAAITERVRVGATISSSKTPRVGSAILSRLRQGAGIALRERTSSTITRRSR